MAKRTRSTEFKWRDGYRTSVDAGVAQAELERIRFADGALTADGIVERSRAEDAPLHAAFEWDDSVCGDVYRRQQARTLIRAIVKISDGDGIDHREYTLVTVPANDDGTGYLPTSVVAKDVDLFADALRRLVGEVTSAQRAARELEDVAGAVATAPERMAKIALASRALETAAVAVAALH